jgi:hypothetical protein
MGIAESWVIAGGTPEQERCLSYATIGEQIPHRCHDETTLLFDGFNNKTRKADSRVWRTAFERSEVAESGRKRGDRRVKDLMAQRLQLPAHRGA